MSDFKDRDRKGRDEDRSHVDDWSDPSKRPQLKAWVPLTLFGVGVLLLILYGAMAG